MQEKDNSEKLVTSTSVEEILRQAEAYKEKQRPHKVTKPRTTNMFIRTQKVGGNIYHQVCRYYYDEEGKRKIEIAKVIWPDRSCKKVEKGFESVKRDHTGLASNEAKK